MAGALLQNGALHKGASQPAAHRYLTYSCLLYPIIKGFNHVALLMNKYSYNRSVLSQ